MLDNVRVGRGVQSRNQGILCTSPTPCPAQCKKLNKSSFAITPHFFHFKQMLKIQALEAGFNVPNCEVSFPWGKWFGAVITLFMRHKLMSLILKHNVTSFSQHFNIRLEKKKYEGPILIGVLYLPIF